MSAKKRANLQAKIKIKEELQTAKEIKRKIEIIKQYAEELKPELDNSYSKTILYNLGNNSKKIDGFRKVIREILYNINDMTDNEIIINEDNIIICDSCGELKYERPWIINDKAYCDSCARKNFR